jgi:hypothetical protein
LMVTEFVTDPDVAVIVAWPVATPVTTPALFTLATLLAFDVHVTLVVISRVVLSENVPVAVNCSVWPAVKIVLGTLIAIDDSVALVTIMLVEPLSPPELAVMVAVPLATAVAKPLAEMVAIAALDDVHFAVSVTSCVLPLPRVAVAVNCWVLPGATVGLPGVTAIDTTALLETKNLPHAIVTPSEAIAAMTSSVRRACPAL